VYCATSNTTYSMISEIQRLIKKFPNGFADFKEKDGSDELDEEE